jgi:hypothetical protein
MGVMRIGVKIRAVFYENSKNLTRLLILKSLKMAGLESVKIEGTRTKD